MNKIGIILSLFIFCKCTDQSAKGSRDQIIGKWFGTWEGNFRTDTMMLEFRKDSTIVLDYTKAENGSVLKKKYSFESDSVINIHDYERMRIVELNENLMSFRPMDSIVRKDINIIYTIKFTRQLNNQE